MSGAGKTKLLLADCMKTLMQEMPLERISVSDIVERAEIGRNTFYYHFQDKYDLVIWIFQTETAALFADGLGQDGWYAALERLEEYMIRNREFYCSALAYDGQNSLRDYLFELFKDLAVQQVEEQAEAEGSRIDPQELEFVGEFFASAMQGMLVRWAKQGMRTLPLSYRRRVHWVMQSKWARTCFFGEYAADRPILPPAARL